MTLLHRTALPLLALGLLSVGGPGGVPSPGSIEPTTGLQGAPEMPASPDTLRTSAEPGTPLILTLPAELDGRFVEHYSLLKGPALSGVAGRSFTWIPEGAEAGMHEALLRTHASDAPPDTLVVQINLQP